VQGRERARARDGPRTLGIGPAGRGAGHGPRWPARGGHGWLMSRAGPGSRPRGHRGGERLGGPAGRGVGLGTIYPFFFFLFLSLFLFKTWFSLIQIQPHSTILDRCTSKQNIIQK
jgi:hypothetical protein